MIKDNLLHRCGQKGEGDYRDVSPVPLGSKDSHDPQWLRAKSLHSIMIKYKMIEMKV
ncbi:hypothetical protein [Saccharolobus islandicus]|uniref:Uncharacterized protein n=1 Tax=Saccharolobus islandicus (strain L.D.8.5 / Lassen \|nr:hypothetical protein [Sulfolobus islandicus]ADB86362.1 hypothetical protein LD85_0625 [Sulfolobus islandicus L.D.8.5]